MLSIDRHCMHEKIEKVQMHHEMLLNLQYEIHIFLSNVRLVIDRQVLRFDKVVQPKLNDKYQIHFCKQKKPKKFLHFGEILSVYK